MARCVGSSHEAILRSERSYAARNAGVADADLAVLLADIRVTDV